MVTNITGVLPKQVFFFPYTTCSAYTSFVGLFYYFKNEFDEACQNITRPVAQKKKRRLRLDFLNLLLIIIKFNLFCCSQSGEKFGELPLEFEVGGLL